nr:GspH/FimT family pseudopilin [Massilia sp. IC2-477]
MNWIVTSGRSTPTEHQPMATPRACSHRPAGFTLAEMLVTVAVLALAAAIAVPNAAPAGAFAADAAASEVARAIRFAQREAIRTGTWHAVRFEVASQSLLVYRLTATGAQDPDYKVLHPVGKAEYDISLRPIGQLASAQFKYKKRPVNSYISFRPDGTPASFDPGAPAGDLLEQDGKVVLTHGDIQRSVSVARVTGRVTF